MPEDACAALIAAARQAGGPDNITAVVVHIAGQ
jgi:serine/threonine protein phosphatase PrpC